MRLTLRSILAASLALAGAAATWAAPAIRPNGIVNAASYAAPNLPNGPVAQGAMFVVFGTGLGPAAIQVVNAFPLPTALGGTSVKVTVGGTTVDCIMIYTLATQIAAILPSNTPAGDGTMTVTYNGETSPPQPVRVNRGSFGIFTRNQAGSGPAIIQNFVTQTELPVNAITDTARPGQTVILWGTGLGPVSGNEAAGPLPGDLPADVQVFVGGQQASIAYKGRSGCCAGLDQIVFVVPDGVEGCYVPLTVRVNGVASNFGSMSISRGGGVCSDPLSFSSEDLNRLRTTGRLRAGSINLSRTTVKLDVPPFGTFENRSDAGSASFLRMDEALLASLGPLAGISLTGSCMVFQSADLDVDDPVAFPYLDAGATLRVTGPRGVKQMQRDQEGFYYGDFGGGTNIPGFPPPEPDYLDPGTYRVEGTGGADVGAFQATVVVPQPLVWTNESQTTTVPRSRDLLVTWTGGDPSKDYVTIFGASGIAVEEDEETDGDSGIGAFFVCVERNSAGRFSVPAYVLGALPGSAGGPGLLGIGSAGEGTRFTASGLDTAVIDYSNTSLKTVAYE